MSTLLTAIFESFWRVGWEMLFAYLAKSDIATWEIMDEQGKDGTRRLRILARRMPKAKPASGSPGSTPAG